VFDTIGRSFNRTDDGPDRGVCLLFICDPVLPDSVEQYELNFWAISAINDELFNASMLHAQRVLLSSHPQSLSGSLHIHKTHQLVNYFL
jgi:hypothetical protein